MKDHVARYYATAYVGYAYDAAFMPKIGQPENLLYTHSGIYYISFKLFTLFANWHCNIDTQIITIYARTLFTDVSIA